MPISSLSDWESGADIAASVATVLGVLIAGAWAYWLYVRQRTRWPRADLELVLTHRRLTDRRTLLHANVKVHNAGRGLMKPVELRLDLHRILPLSPATQRTLKERGELLDDARSEADWPCIHTRSVRWKVGAVEIEPGENGEFPSDFFVDSEVATVLVYVYLDNQAKHRRVREWLSSKGLATAKALKLNQHYENRRPRRLGWSLTTIYDLADDAGTGSVDNLVGREAMIEEQARDPKQRPDRQPDVGIEEAQREPRPQPELENSPEQGAGEPGGAGGSEAPQGQDE